MKKLFIVANWKSNKDSIQVNDWIDGFKNYDLRFTNKEVVICPSFVHLSILKSYILNHKSNIKIGAQDVSQFEEGAFTGEVSSRQIKEFGDYVIIGHSERRKNFKEDDAILAQKVAMAKKYGLTPIFCVQDENTPIPSGITIVAYEPPSAIGTGIPDMPESADNIARKIKSKLGEVFVLYGGSVKSDNVKSFINMENIDGVLVGGASLDPLEFGKIIKNA